jgi:hypothetical protein
MKRVPFCLNDIEALPNTCNNSVKMGGGGGYIMYTYISINVNGHLDWLFTYLCIYINVNHVHLRAIKCKCT